ncbi:MAG TPA: hypothetical protein VFZ53_22255 [Polyangiaceae bacterium]
MTLSAKPKFPIFGLGQSFNGGVLGDATIEIRGSGLVATCYGLPGLTATLVATGLYDVRYPPARGGARFWPQPQAPEGKGPTGALIGPQGSGVRGNPPGFEVFMSQVGGPTGSAYLNTVSPLVNPSGAVGPTGAQYVFPPTGSLINLLVTASPIARY